MHQRIERHSMKKFLILTTAAALVLSACGQPRNDYPPQPVQTQQVEQEDCDADDLAEGDEDCYGEYGAAAVGGAIGGSLYKKHKKKKASYGSSYKPSRSSFGSRSSGRRR